uniref:Uncharacterized protein n=1 Tax=Arundo donax TaxID=35708 RepID=A0A0A9CX54_ARUDO
MCCIAPCQDIQRPVQVILLPEHHLPSSWQQHIEWDWTEKSSLHLVFSLASLQTLNEPMSSSDQYCVEKNELCTLVPASQVGPLKLHSFQ